MLQKCAAHSPRTGEPCRNWPIRGATVCRMHGASTAVRRAAAARLLDQQLTQAVQTAHAQGFRGTKRREVTDPLGELVDITSEVLELKDHIRTLVEGLHHLSSRDAKGAEQIHALVGAYERALDRSATWLATVARLGIDERMARVNEAQTQMVVRAFEAGLAAIGVAGPQVLAAKTAMAANLKRIAA